MASAQRRAFPDRNTRQRKQITAPADPFAGRNGECGKPAASGPLPYPIIIFSSGNLDAALIPPCLFATAAASVKGPTRPRNIIGSRTALLAEERFGVPRADTPTVPMALEASKKISASGKCPFLSCWAVIRMYRNSCGSEVSDLLMDPGERLRILFFRIVISAGEWYDNGSGFVSCLRPANPRAETGAKTENPPVPEGNRTDFGRASGLPCTGG